MKKLYTLALAAVVALGVNAAAPQQLKHTDGRVKQPAKKTMVAENAKSDALKVQSRAEATSTEGISGDYVITIYDCYFGQESVGLYDCRGSIVENNDGTITLDSEDFPSAIKADYNASTGEVTFKNIDLGKVTVEGATYYLRFEPGIYVEDATGKGTIKNESYSVKYDATGRFISFPDDHNFAWVAYKESTYTTAVGYFDLFDVIEIMAAASEEPIDEEQDGQWKYVGEATFIDAWVMPCYTIEDKSIDPNDYPYKVELQRNIANPDLYRLWKPYTTENCPMLAFNNSKFNGQIVFDISDPNHVIVKPGFPAGFNDGSGEMYNFNLLGWQIWMFGDSYDPSYLPGIIDFMADKGQPFATAKDGVVTVNRSVFDVNASCSKAYTWQNPSTYVSKIIFPEGGVESSLVDAEGSVKEYFNLQGVRVANPSNGVYIVRQNGKATKEYVR
ncbi:MAG: hypothetical protein K2M19_04765 [Muribaculaceae bacterium]|nr:hypothetical protein [Muribaculaceae bacterium]